MKLKLDENLNERGRALLEGAGHDVSTVVLQGMQGALDGAVIEACRRERRALVTLDMERLCSLTPRGAGSETVSGELVKPTNSDRLERGMKHIPREDLLKRIRVSLILDWLAA